MSNRCRIDVILSIGQPSLTVRTSGDSARQAVREQSRNWGGASRVDIATIHLSRTATQRLSLGATAAWRGVAWRGVAWRCAAWRGAASLCMLLGLPACLPATPVDRRPRLDVSRTLAVACETYNCRCQLSKIRGCYQAERAWARRKG